jgi:glycosyltransferase involved in cell wall biosynthesis/SAM-dependent methyltransferase
LSDPTPYDTFFFAKHVQASLASARVVLPLLFEHYRPDSIVDVGCGVGPWLKCAQSLGVNRVLGLDGDYVDRSGLQIDESAFRAVDLSRSIDITERFDLAICLEVAEHLPFQRSETFVADLVSLSDVVLFSAALPFQGGTDHINEQWLEFWAILFRQHGYVPCDFLRPRIWANPEVEFWYAQNIVVFCRRSIAEGTFPAASIADNRALSLPHPLTFVINVARYRPYFAEARDLEYEDCRTLLKAYLSGETRVPPMRVMSARSNKSAEWLFPAARTVITDPQAELGAKGVEISRLMSLAATAAADRDRLVLNLASEVESARIEKLRLNADTTRLTEANSSLTTELGARDARIERQYAELNRMSVVLAEERRKCEKLTIELAARNNVIGFRDREIERRAEDLAAERASRLSLQELLSETQRTLESRERACSETLDKLRTLQRQFDRTSIELAESRHTVGALRHSKSWRVTAPLRRGVDGIQAVSRVARPTTREEFRHPAGKSGRLKRLLNLALLCVRSLARRDGNVSDLCSLFDSAYYRGLNGDVALSVWHAFGHYLYCGGVEGRSPHPWFDGKYYMRMNPDVRSSAVNPLVHYVFFGAKEGRSPHPDFDPRAYTNAHQELGGSGKNPLLHFVRIGGGAVPHDLAKQTLGPALAPALRQEHFQEMVFRAAAGSPEHSTAELRLTNASNSLSQALAGCSSLVSVVIATHNYGTCVGEAINSVLAQTYTHVEVIVVDDESTDPVTIEFLGSLRDPRVTVIRQTNQGLAQTRNNGAAAATGEYLMFLDCDDRLERHAIALLMYSLQENPADAYAYPYQRFFGDQELVWMTQSFNAYDLLWSNHPTVCSLFRRGAFDEVAGYKGEFRAGYEDWELYLRLSGCGHNGRCVPAPVFEYRRHGTTMSHFLGKRQQTGLGQMLSINSGLYEPHSITRSKSKWRPLISVVIPFYNSPRYLNETLDSLRSQTIQDFEVILINDGSDEPESLRTLEDIRAESWVRVVDAPHEGLPATRNRGAIEARAELLMFLDSDDYLDPSALEKLCWLIATQPQHAFVYSGVVHFGEVQGLSYEEFDAARLHKENYLAATCVIRRSIYLELGGNDPAMIRSWEDYDFWLRLTSKGYTGLLFREPLFHYRRHEGGISRQLVKEEATRLEDISRFVVARHLERDSSAQPPPLRPGDVTPSGLVEEVAGVLCDLVPASIHAEKYRRTNLPNLFCPKRWSGEKIRVLYLIPFFHIGGAEVFDLRILSCLSRDRFSVVLVACEKPEGPLYEEFKSAVDDEIFCLERMGADHEDMMAFLKYLMISRNIDVVFNRNTMYGYDLAESWPAISSQVRFADLLHVHAFGEDWVRSSAPYHDKLDLRYVSSGDLPAYVAARYKFAPDDFSLLDYGFKPDELPDESTCAAWRTGIRQEWNIPQSAFVVGFAGRITGQKDPLRWLSVAAAIAGRRDNTLFLVIGDGDLLPEMMAAVAGLGLADKIIFAGYQRDAAAFTCAMDVLLMTSVYEGLPMMVLHSLAHGTPVVSSDVGSIAGCLTQETGCVLPDEASAAEYGEAVLRWRDTDTKATGRACREIVATRFSQERLAKKLTEDLSSLASDLDIAGRRNDYQMELMKKPIVW